MINRDYLLRLKTRTQFRISNSIANDASLIYTSVIGNDLYLVNYFPFLFTTVNGGVQVSLRVCETIVSS